MTYSALFLEFVPPRFMLKQYMKVHDKRSIALITLRAYQLLVLWQVNWEDFCYSVEMKTCLLFLPTYFNMHL